MAFAASRLAAVHYGRVFEDRCMELLRSRLSMTLAYVGGRGDGGVDFQGWWWVPRLPPDTSDERRRIRILAQCKALDKKLGPIHIRELEGAALLHSNTGSAKLLKPDETSAPQPGTSPELTAVLCSISGFSTFAIRRAMASPVPFLLLHLPSPSPGDDQTPYLESMVWNSKLGSSHGLLGGHMEIRQLIAGNSSHPALYWQGKRLEHWTPELEPEIHVGRYNPPPTS
ncbi:hypothetical protein RhiJN_09932 [Ceratobasidium sp. AG-Ba]|nr:hypothetical protein RhiJN_09932 [Ceratobasidium sp. AG-Ba]QRW10694.1 hypothetical protein RhiLY_09693 [Ceratobasidium sp. AG-Ba]